MVQVAAGAARTCRSGHHRAVFGPGGYFDTSDIRADAGAAAAAGMAQVTASRCVRLRCIAQDAHHGRFTFISGESAGQVVQDNIDWARLPSQRRPAIPRGASRQLVTRYLAPAHLLDQHDFADVVKTFGCKGHAAVL